MKKKPTDIIIYHQKFDTYLKNNVILLQLSKTYSERNTLLIMMKSILSLLQFEIKITEHKHFLILFSKNRNLLLVFKIIIFLN